MATKTYLPTKTDQEATNAKIDALASSAATASALETAQASLDEANEKIDALDTKTDDTLIRVTTLQAKVNELEGGFSTARMATLTLTLNATGTSYEVPTDETVIAELLKGAKFVLTVNGNEYPYESAITTLENASVTFRVYVTDGAKVGVSYAGVSLGSSTTCAYAVAAQQIRLTGGETKTISLTSHKVTVEDGDTVELFRIQPYAANPSALPSSTTNDRLKAGNSYLGIRITNSSGTTTRLGHWTENQDSWVDESFVKISLWDIPKNSDGTPGTPAERVISDTSVAGNWVPIEDYLDCLKNIKIGTINFKYVTKDSTTEIAGDNKVVRYDKLYVKTTFEEFNMPILQADDSLLENKVWCVVKWYANKPLTDYHLHPLFIKYARSSEGVYSEKECAHGYIARYPVGNTVTTKIDGESKTIPIWEAGGKREMTMGKRSDCVANFRNLNKLTATMTFDGEDAVTISPDDTNHTWGGCGTAEISFLQNLAYLYFGVSVQGYPDPSTTDYTKNLFPGICTTAVSATLNGDTDFVIAAGKVNGAINTASPTNSICFLGVEDALWSSTGWDWNDLTLVTRRVMTANTDGSLASDVVTTSFLFCQDPALVTPDEGKDISNETTVSESLSFEGKLKSLGYRETQFDVGTGTNYRRGLDTSAVLRDAGLPAGVQDQHNLNIGACDNFWRGSTPSDFSFSTSTTYAVGDYVKYSNAVYQCTATHSAGAWNDSHFALVTGDAETVVTRRSYWRVSLGNYRSSGRYLGAFTVVANGGLTNADGNYWRTRPLLRVVS